ncbi:DUF4843 domain-containing protein [Aestuariibaculum suncheonense]|uniref:DUF4843 domain-containing protein n=1 Tax=Aestuariibaculum suncheonense TaxID=1028745 RepID=A0A8J6QF08_9FLAO|nr:DUF4843 domain-containing protein [Aestuariibaculum suncheonense]MBD0834516.1 DUF4843 domain-containing protein [Aestuariibaculum suncheonense]
MNKIIKYVMLLGLSCFMLGCNEDSLDTYTGKDSIYYTWSVEGVYLGTSRTYPDSTGFTFAFKGPEITQEVYKLPVSVQGQVTDYDREISVVLDASSTAIKGVHFDLPETIVFKANQEKDSIPITLYRTEEMKDNSYSIKLNLVEGKDFVVDMKEVVLDEATGETLSFTKFELAVEDILRTPKNWYYYFLGDFSAKKLFLINEVMGIPLDFYDQDPRDYDAMRFHGSFMQRYLNEKRAAGEAIYEDDGTEMVMGPSVQK